MDHQTIRTLLDKYLQGNCTMEEVEKIHAWLKQVQRQDNEWPAHNEQEQARYLDGLYQDITHSIGRRAEKTRQRTIRRRFIQVAASVALLCGMLAAFYVFPPWNTDPPRLTRTAGYATERTAMGEIKELTLEDGSVIWLNAGSTLRYPDKFQGGTREVILEGEAFFDIARDTARPFLIHTAGMETRVLGTSFNVRAYSHQEPAQVIVVSGTVEVSVPAADGPETKKVLLEANQMVTYGTTRGTSGGELAKETVDDPEQYTAWKYGKLIFKSTPMSEVALQLERTFGLRIRMQDQAIERCRITGRFDKSQEVSLTIEAICKSIEAEFRLNGDTVYIKGPGCEAWEEI